MNWSRYKVLIITGAITLLLTGGAVFWWMKTSSANEKLMSDIQRLESTKKSLSSEPVFPSRESKLALEAEQKKVEDLRNQLILKIEEGQLVPAEKDRPGFGDYVKGTLVPGLRRSAKNSTLGGEEGVILQDDTFGLSEYLEEGRLPAKARIPALMLELETMAHLCEILFESGISELGSVKAIQPPEENDARRTATPFGNNPATPGFNRPSLGQPTPGAEEAEKDPREEIAEEVERLFTPLEFKLTFKVYEDFLWELMNNLLSDPNQITVKSFTITNDNETLWPKGIVKPALGSSVQKPKPAQPKNDLAALLAGMEAGTGGQAATEKSEEAKAGLEERRLRMTGGEMLYVEMNVILYRIKPQLVSNEGF